MWHVEVCILMSVACGRLWLSVCSPPLLLFFHLSLFVVRPLDMFWFPRPESPRVRLSPQRHTVVWKGDTGALSVAFGTTGHPFVSTAPNSPPPTPHIYPPPLQSQSHTGVPSIWSTLFSVTVRVEGGECEVVTMILHLHRPPTPKPPRMPCVCVLCIHQHPHPPKKKNKKRAWRIVEEEPVL